ncbi:ABC transporter ATP-binding protein [Microbacterium sp.]|uniref:ABC transporter ATP-binding protein n=1 Tax=Microbacterium sp. TaxID=51671 RepID=UPI003C721A6E
MTTSERGPALVTGRGLGKRYVLPKESLFSRSAYRDAVIDVDIDLYEGETTAIIGESGSGKSTLLRLVLGLARPTTGEARFDGRLVEPGAPSRLRWLRGATGIVLQDPYASLDPRFTVAQTIAEPLEALRRPGDHAARVREVLGQVGLPAWRAEQYPHELSGGQRQRVALARAIVHHPRLLVGDEPLSALDVTVRAQILDLLRTLRESLGLTIVLVSHDIGLVQHVADRVIVMKDGRVVETGRTADVLRAPGHDYTRTLLASVPRLIDKETS